jgi:hypothetical protein
MPTDWLPWPGKMNATDMIGPVPTIAQERGTPRKVLAFRKTKRPGKSLRRRFAAEPEVNFAQ